MNNNIKIANKLRSSGLRPTKQRVLIAEFLFEREKTFHFTVEDLENTINSKRHNKKISIATFYNTVHALKNAGYLKEILTKNNKCYFDTNIGSHHHFFDLKNKKLTDIDSSKIKLKNIPNAPKGKSIKDIDIVINIENDYQ
ncbi:MAG: Fur family transcriptional regulator [Pelagibacteraceae bacterium]